MPIVIEATYENGMLKPSEPLPLKEHERVWVTVEPEREGQRLTGLIPCSDTELIEQAALDKELEYEQ